MNLMEHKKDLWLYLVLFITSIPTTVSAQVAIEWQKCIGNVHNNEIFDIDEDPQGNFILTGYSYGQGNGNDLILIKTDSIGNQLWLKNYGGTGNDQGIKVLASLEGGYMILGSSTSNDGDVTGAHGATDAWLIKTDDDGNIIWNKAVGGDESESFNSLIQLADGNYLAMGYTNSGNGDLTGVNPGSNTALWILKFDSSGTFVDHMAIYGGANLGHGLLQTSDGGYICTGGSGTPSGFVITNYGSTDLCVLKLDSMFNIEWVKIYGGTAWDNGFEIIETPNGEYVIGGITNSYDLYVSGNHGISDYWIVKLDSIGNMIWQKCLGGTGYDNKFFALHETSDGNYLAAGTSFGSINGNISNPYDGYDFWMAAVDTSGNFLWDKSLGGGKYEYEGAMIKTSDGSYLLTGSTRSYDFDVSGRIGPLNVTDGWMVKFHDQPNRIMGKAYIDNNLNLVHDPGEQTVPLHFIRESNSSKYTVTNSSGMYTLNVPFPGTYTVTCDSLSYTNVVPASHTITFTGINQVDSLIDFALQPIITSAFDLSISLTANGPIRPGFTTIFTITYHNTGTVPITGEIIFQYPFEMTYSTATPVPDYIGTDSIIWNFSNLMPFESRTINVSLVYPVSGLGNQVIFIAEIQPVPGDVRPDNNRDTIIDIVVGSFDPNDIAVDIDLIHPTQASNPPFLEYLIRFQNTGTYLAEFVEIANPISPLLDMSTFELIAVSHDAEVNFMTHSRNLDFFFEDIFLADSVTNEPESHGFVRYRIKPYPTLVLGDTIPNQAFIYFDYNPPVATNIATTIVDYPVAVIEHHKMNQQLVIHPNPSSGKAFIRFESDRPTPVVVSVYNMMGEKVFRESEKHSTRKFIREFSFTGLPSGIYIVEILSDFGITSGKLIKN